MRGESTYQLRRRAKEGGGMHRMKRRRKETEVKKINGTEERVSGETGKKS